MSTVGQIDQRLGWISRESNITVQETETFQWKPSSPPYQEPWIAGGSWSRAHGLLKGTAFPKVSSRLTRPHGGTSLAPESISEVALATFTQKHQNQGHVHPHFPRTPLPAASIPPPTRRLLHGNTQCHNDEVTLSQTNAQALPHHANTQGLPLLGVQALFLHVE